MPYIIVPYHDFFFKDFKITEGYSGVLCSRARVPKGKIYTDLDLAHTHCMLLNNVTSFPFTVKYVKRPDTKYEGVFKP